MTLLLLSVTSAAARADDPSSKIVKRAKLHFVAGIAAFNAARYELAIEEFKADYALVPRPSALFNIAMSYYKLDSYAQALDYAQRFLDAADENDPDRAKALELAHKLRALDKPAPAPVVVVVGKSAPTEPPAAAAATPPAVVTHMAEHRNHGWRRDPAAITLLTMGAASAAVGAGLLGYGVSLAERSRRSYQDYVTTQPALSITIAGGVLIGAGGVLALGWLGRYAALKQRGRSSSR